MGNNFPPAAIMAEIDLVGAVTIPDFLGKSLCRRLLAESKVLTYSSEEPVVGKYNVRQNFSAAVANTQIFDEFRITLQSYLNTMCAVVRPNPLSEYIAFNEMRIQRYEPSSLGIGIHRDGKSFVNLIAVLVLEGKGDFCVCVDRELNGIRSLRNEPGDLILMRGPGFFKSTVQPFHLVRNITERRTTLGLRQKK